MNETSSWYDYYWNFRDLLQVPLPEVVSNCYVEIILVIFCLRVAKGVPRKPQKSQKN